MRQRCEHLKEEEAFYQGQFLTDADGVVTITTQEGNQLQISGETMKRISREIMGVTPTGDDPPPLPPKGKHSKS